MSMHLKMIFDGLLQKIHNSIMLAMQKEKHSVVFDIVEIFF